MQKCYHNQLRLIIIFTVFLSCFSIQCPPGLDLVPQGSPFGSCISLGCSKPTQYQQCSQQCLPGFIKTQTKTCQVIQCSSVSKTRCQSCQRGYQLQIDLKNQEIRTCVPSNCQLFDKITRKCNKCVLGYQLQKIGICALANCQQSRLQSSECISCQKGYALTLTKQGIHVCLPQNCQLYDMQNYQCSVCQNLYFKQQQTGLCKSGIKNCINFSEISSLCYQCQKGYKLVGLKNCIKQNPICIEYGLNGCTVCKPSYYPLNGKCFPNNCIKISSQNNQQCDSCDVGYKLNSQKLCEVQGCQAFDKQKYRCSKCKELYMAYHLPSASKPNINVQRCITRNCDIYDRTTYKCLRCGQQYELVQGVCLLKNCQNPNLIKCQKCIDGWKSNIRGNCVQLDCLQYNQQAKCKTCTPQKRLYKGQCIKDNCNVRKPDGTCSQCLNPYVIDKAFPKYCVTKFCSKIDQSSGDCIQCYANFHLNKNAFCQSSICKEFSKQQDGKCLKCQQGYEVKQNYCVLSTKFCTQFNLQENKCSKCVDDYSLDPKTDQCELLNCHDEDDKSPFPKCLQCNLGYQLIILSNSVQKCSLMNCTKQEKNKCMQCKQGFTLLGQICVANNCKSFTESGLCTACVNGFRFDPVNLICSRIKCKKQNIQSCLECQKDYYIDTSDSQLRGLCLPYNCQKITYNDLKGNVICQKCESNFIYMSNIEKCVANDCQNFDQISGICLQCRQGFQKNKDGSCILVRNNGYCSDRKYPGTDFVCRPMIAQNCLSANPINTAKCLKCEKKFFLRNGYCYQFTNCPEQFRNPYMGCIRCNLGYKTSENGLCESIVQNCNYFDDKGECQQCERGYQIILYPSKICKKLPNYCLSLDPWGNCAQCREPSKTLTDKYQCILKTESCTKYDQISGFCSECKKYYYLQNDFVNPTFCRQNPPNCDIASKKDVCLACKNSFVLNDGVCYPAIENCLMYSKGKCVRCPSNQFIQSSTGKCKSLPRYCDKIILNSDGACQQCRQGFVNVVGVCLRKIQFCATYDPQSGRCAGCIGGYSLAASRMLCLVGHF